MNHLLSSWRKLASDSVVEGILDRVNAKPGTGTEWIVNNYRGRSLDEMVTAALTRWRGSFIASSNIRAYLEGREMAPAYRNDPDYFILAEVLREALVRAPALGAVTWRLEAGEPLPGQSLDWRIKAVATHRRHAEEFRYSLMLDHATMYEVPARAKGLWFPDRLEAVVTGHFTVESMEAGVAVLR